jgi:hypothetical protein
LSSAPAPPEGLAAPVTVRTVAAMSDATCYAVTFRTEAGEPVTLRVKEVTDSALGPSFLCLSDFVFDSGRIVDPKQEALQRRFEGTRRLHLNVFHIQSIEEVGLEHPGLTLEHDRSKLILLPGPGAES